MQRPLRPICVAAGAGALGFLGLVLLLAQAERNPRPMSSAGAIAEADTDEPGSRSALEASRDLSRESQESSQEHARTPAAESIPVAAPPTTARRFLAAYHGDRWPEIEAAIEAAGLDLDMPYKFTPWEAVEAEVGDRIGFSEESQRTAVGISMKWTETLTPDFINAKFPMPEAQKADETDVPVIAGMVQAKNEELRATAEHRALLIDVHLRQKWRSGDYVRAPFTTHGVNDRVGFAGMATGGKGWAVAVTLQIEECPDVHELNERMWELRSERDELVMGYLRGKYGR